MTMMKSSILLFAVLLALSSIASAKILPFLDPFREGVPLSNLQQATKQALDERKLASVRRSLKKSSKGSSSKGDNDTKKGLTTKKSGTRMSKGSSSSKSSKKSSSKGSSSSKSSKKSSSKGVHASDMNETIANPDTEMPMSEDRIVSDDTPSNNNNMSEDRIVSEDTTGNMSEDTDREGDEDFNNDGADSGNQEDANDDEGTGTEGDANDDEVTGTEGDANDGGEETEERIEEIFTDTWEFAMVRSEAGTADSQENFSMTSVIAMSGLLHEITAAGAIDDVDSVGNFRAVCTVTSMDHNVLCSYNIQLLTPGENGVGEFMARGHVMDHEAENVALVTGSTFDFERYTEGGSLEMRPDSNDPMVLYCSLSLRYARTRLIN